MMGIPSSRRVLGAPVVSASGLRMGRASGVAARGAIRAGPGSGRGAVGTSTRGAAGSTRGGSGAVGCSARNFLRGRQRCEPGGWTMVRSSMSQVRSPPWSTVRTVPSRRRNRYCWIMATAIPARDAMFVQ